MNTLKNTEVLNSGASCMAICMSLVFALGYAVILMRSGLGVTVEEWGALVSLFLVTAFLCYFPGWGHTWLNKRFSDKSSLSGSDYLPWYRSEAFVFVLGFVLVMLLGLIGGWVVPFSWLATPLLGVTGLILLGKNLLIKEVKSQWAPALTGFMIGIWMVGWLYGQAINSPLFMDLLQTGNTHMDTLYHVSVAQMIHTYGVPSTGLHGIPLLNYHFGSHFFFATLSNIIHTNLLHTYLMAYPILLIPCFFKAFFLLVHNMRHRLQIAPTQRSQPSADCPAWVVWLVILIGTVGVLPIAAQHKLLLDLKMVYSSQSYTLALMLAFALSALLVHPHLWPPYLVKFPSRSKFWFWLGMFPVFMLVIGMCKISVLAVMTGTLGYFYLRFRWYRFIPMIISATITLCLAIIAYQYCNSSADHLLLKPFNFFNAMLRQTKPWAPLFFIVYFGWTLLGTGLSVIRGLKSHRRRTTSVLQSLWAYCDHPLFIYVEMMWVMALVVLLPVNIIDTIGGSEFYFVDVQLWFAFAVFLACGAFLWPSFISNTIDPLQRNALKTGALIFSAMIVINTVQSFQQGTAAIQSDIQKLSASTHNTLPDKDGHTQTHHIMALLQQLEQLSLSEKKNSLVFIPKSVAPFWQAIDSTSYVYACQSASYMIPALSGMAALHGLPPDGCPTENLRFEAYPLGEKHPTDEGKNKKDAYDCKQVRELGFKRLFVLQPDLPNTDEPYYQFESIDCDAG